MIINGVKKIPKAHIMKRWTRDARDYGAVWFLPSLLKFLSHRCYIGMSMLYRDVAWCVWTLIKNKLQNPQVNRETNLLSPINLPLAHVLL